MIRINLLGVHKAKGKRPAVSISMGGGEGSNLLVVILVVAALTIGGNFYFWQRLNREKVDLATRMEKAQAESRRLAAVKAQVDEAEKQEANYRHRLEIIDQLRARQFGPVELLAMVGNSVNDTDAVWLTAMTDQGNTINIEGASLSHNAVANLMQTLRRSGYFKNVEIKESYQDESVKEMQAFVFTLVCEKLQQQQKS